MGNLESNKKVLVVCVIAALVILAIAIIITLFTNLYGFCIVLVALFIILAVCLSVYMKESPDEFSIFIKEKKRILKTYDSVIVEVETLPNIAGKNIIKVKTFDDLVDAQLELREPIYYKNDNDSCFFLLLHYNEACVFILKINDEVISPTEQSIRFMKPEKGAVKSDYENMLENLENTMVYKLDELRSFKISPVRSKKKVEIVDDTAIKDVLEHTTQISKKELEDELSKTQYLKDLKKRIEDYDNDRPKHKATEADEPPVREIKKREFKKDIKKTVDKKEEPVAEVKEEKKEEKIDETIKELTKAVKEETAKEPKEEKTKAEIPVVEKPKKEEEKPAKEEKKEEAKEEKEEPKKATSKKPAKKKIKVTHATRRTKNYKSKS